MKKVLLILLAVNLMSCAQKTEFDTVALNETFTNTKGNQIAFKDILAKHKGKTIFIDVWASWCHDCVGSLPKLKELQTKEKDLVYVMLSVDKTIADWKKGIAKHELKANHYFITKGWKGKNASEFCKSINLDWIPRYMIVGKDGKIKMFKAIKFSDKNIEKIIKEDR